MTPLEQVTEILPVPSVITRTQPESSLLGIVVHRGAAVPVLCLAQLLDRTPAPVGASSCILLVSVDGDQIAFAVDSLQGIDPLSWTDPERSASPGPLEPSEALRSSPWVQVGGRSQLIPELDLRAVAHAVRARTGPIEPSTERAESRVPNSAVAA